MHETTEYCFGQGAVNERPTDASVYIYIFFFYVPWKFLDYEITFLYKHIDHGVIMFPPNTVISKTMPDLLSVFSTN